MDEKPRNRRKEGRGGVLTGDGGEGHGGGGGAGGKHGNGSKFLMGIDPWEQKKKGICEENQIKLETLE